MTIDENDSSTTNIQQLLMNIWKSVLGLDEEPMPEDDFFDLGGQSLLVVKMLSRFRKQLVTELGIDISFSGPALYHEFAKKPTIENLENLIKGLQSVHDLEQVKQSQLIADESTDEFVL